MAACSYCDRPGQHAKGCRRPKWPNRVALMRAKRRDAGLCVTCQEPSASYRCDDCNTRHAKLARARRAA